MRLNPVASAGSIRKIGRNITTRDGFTIPKGSTCFLPFMLLFRNPEVFPEPDSFIPSRWENATREQLEAFQPFSLGKQNCVGQSLARAETTSIIARIISEFELSVDESSSISSEFFLTLKPVNAILRARKI
jgi:cytochrome P450